MNEQPIGAEIEMNELSVSNEELAAANEQLQTEIAKRKLSDERIVHLNSVLKAIRNVNQLITRERDRERLIQKTCDLLVETRGYKVASLLLVDGDKSFAAAGVSDEQGLSTLVEQMKQGQYPKCVHEVLTGEQSVLVYDDVRNQHQGCVLADCNDSRAAFVARLEYDGKVYGAIVVGVPSETAWDEEEQGLFQELAGDISYALAAIESEKGRQRVEEALRESRERFRALTENTSDLVWEVNVDGTYTYVSPRVKELLGYEPEEIIGKTPFDLMPAEKTKLVAAAFRTIVETQRPFIMSENANLHKDGRLVVLETSGVPFFDVDGRLCGYRGIDRDITEWKQKDEHIARQRSVLDAINSVLMGTLTCETEEEVAQTCLAVIKKLTDSKFGWIGEVNQAGRLDTIAISNPGWSACRIPRTNLVRMIKNMKIRGIRGKVLKEGRSLIANDPSSHPDWAGTPEGHPQVTSFLGVPLKEAGRTIGMIALGNKESGYDLTDQQDVEAIAVAFVQALKRKRMEHKLRETNEQLNVQNEELQSQAQELRRKTIEVQKANKLKSEFLANMSHGLRTPLNSIIGFSELMIDEVPGKINEEQEQCLSNVLNSSKHLLNLINDVLDISRIESGKKKLKLRNVPLLNVIESITSTVSPILSERKQVLNVEVEEGLPPVYAGKTKLEQVLLNLVDNASKFTPDGGELKIEVTVNRAWCQVSVIDNGVGIKKKDLQRIFEPFCQLDNPLARERNTIGTGLGLALVKQIMKSQGGQIWVESEYGKGSQFIFTVPLATGIEPNAEESNNR